MFKRIIFLSLFLTTFAFANEEPLTKEVQIHYTHKIETIFAKGEAIQLDDGSAWGIGYWAAGRYHEQPLVTNWEKGDQIEFSRSWSLGEIASKEYFYITNLRTEETVTGYLMHSPFAEKTFPIQVLDKVTYTFTLPDSSKWLPYFPATMYGKTTSNALFFIVKRHNDEGYYLLSCGSYGPSYVEVNRQ